MRIILFYVLHTLFLLKYFTVREYEIMHSPILTATPSVTSFEARRNRSVPATLTENITFVCKVDSSAATIPLWRVGRSQNPNSQLPLTPGIELHNGSSISAHHQVLGIITEDNFSEHLSRLIITKAARQSFPLIQVQCKVLDTITVFCNSWNCSSDLYYVVTYGKDHYFFI